LSKTSPSIARYIAANVWKNGGDIRDVISIGKLVRKSDGPEQIELIMETMMKYAVDGGENGLLELLDFENAILDLFEKNRINIQDAQTVLF
jgi:hypothetical protein